MIYYYYILSGQSSAHFAYGATQPLTVRVRTEAWLASFVFQDLVRSATIFRIQNTAVWLKNCAIFYNKNKSPSFYSITKKTNTDLYIKLHINSWK